MNMQFSTAKSRRRFGQKDAAGAEQIVAHYPHGRSLSAAQNRLANAVVQAERRREIQANGYYGSSASIEEQIANAVCDAELGVILTRNHYGSLVLNAARTLFIDVDAPQETQPAPTFDLRPDRWRGRWRQTFDDLRLVLAYESRGGFRIYRTAAGFRILATTRPFVAGSLEAEQLMNTVGADPTYVRLCLRQQCFRARLTPKPWRCGAEKPPHAFPRKSIAEEQCFAHWLSSYDRACRDLATCQFLDHVGPAAVCDEVSPVVELHDRLSRVGERLALA